MKYMKVLNGDISHAGGFSYKIGEVNVASTWNPNLDNPKDFGGFNFSTEDKILRWLLRGDTLYDVHIPEDAEVVEVDSKSAPHGVFRTNKIILTNPRELTEEIVMDLYLKSDLPLTSYFQCLTFLSLKGYSKVCFQILQDKVHSNNIDEAISIFTTFISLEESDKTPCYLEVYKRLQEIKRND